MNEISIEQLEELLLKGRQAAQYAWEHYEALLAREKTYTLYGPETYGIGAGIPGSFIPKRDRKLTKQTRRKNYKIYELDNNFKLLRAITMWNSKEDYTYHCFDLDGIQFACSFINGQKRYFKDEVLAIRIGDKLPQWLGFLNANSLILHLFSYDYPEKMQVNCYTYSRVSKYTVHGYPVDWSAPIGALNSPVDHGCWEEDVSYTDFSEWFK